MIDLQEIGRKLERLSEVETATGGQRAYNKAPNELLKAEKIAVSTRRKKTWLALAALPFILALSIILAVFVRSAPERVIGYSIIVQKMRNGKELEAPFEASRHENESFESGWKFRLRLVSPQSGYLYLLNEGPASDGGEINFSIIFPISSINNGSALIPANEPVLTGWYYFAKRPGVEKLWVVWTELAAQPLEAIKDKVNPVDRGVVSDAVQRGSIRKWLATHTANEIPTENSDGARQSVIRGRGNVVARLITLNHHSARLVGLSDPIRDVVSYSRLGIGGLETVERWRQ
jgi:hypothetical protein